ncbi:MAG: hypothetical protein GX809_06940, partial [Clostridiaceae bacterium]|nr:hypothetical protein [Clostridiaceae bacterium]
VSTLDMTLLRKPSVTHGRTDTGAFDPSEEWIGLPVDTFSYLGNREFPKYKVTFFAGAKGRFETEDPVQQEQEVSYGQDAIPPSIVPDEGYEHAGWNRSYKNITGESSITALYAIRKLSVDFDLDGKGVHTAGSLQQTVNYGRDASSPVVKPKNEFSVYGWDKRFNGIVDDMEVKALYQAWTSPGVFFSEYVEGSGNNKALEIYNGTGLPIDLGSDYKVVIYFDGGSTPKPIPLTGTLQPGSVHVLVHFGAGDALRAKADQITTYNMFNGNDIVMLYKGGTLLDCIGKPDERLDLDLPNQDVVGWRGGGVQTGNRTLVRKAWVGEGVTAIPSNNDDPDFNFDPSLQWISYKQDDFTHLGFHDTSSIHTVKFIQGSGGSLAGQLNQTVYTGRSAVLPVARASEGHTFLGWEGNYSNVLKDETVKALWKTNRYTISFDSAGGSDLPSISQDYGTEIKRPADPVREGYTFLGWDQEVPESMPAGDLKLTAQWKINKHRLTFYTACGTA